MFLCLLWCEHYEENFTFTRLNNLENDSKKPPENQKFTRSLSGCLFVYTFCLFLQVDSYLSAKNFTNTCERARFREHHHDSSRFTIAEVILLARYLGLLKLKQEMGTKVLSSYRIFFTSYYP